MALSPGDKKVEALAQTLVYEWGESLSEAICEAMVARLNQLMKSWDMTRTVFHPDNRYICHRGRAFRRVSIREVHYCSKEMFP
jgi:hypothetical protein